MPGPHIERYVIDVARSDVPGRLCFLPVQPSPTGEDGVVQPLAAFGEVPPVPGVIIGFMFEGSPDELAAWELMQQSYLSKLRILRK